MLELRPRPVRASALNDWLDAVGDSVTKPNRVRPMAQVKQNYADLVDRKTRVMDCIKGLNRELKPAAMHSVHPVMGKDKDAKPDE